MNLNYDDGVHPYIAGLYRLGQHGLLETAPAVAITQHVANLYKSVGISAAIGGLYVVIGAKYRAEHGLDGGEGLYIQELYEDWGDREGEDKWIHDQVLKFVNSALNNDGFTTAVVWQTVINSDSDIRQDTAYIFRLLEDAQEIMHRFDQIIEAE